MTTYYVSLVRDLLGCFLEFEAESERAVRLYLQYEYLHEGTWKLPWCSIYTLNPEEHHLGSRQLVIIKATCGKLYEANFE